MNSERIFLKERLELYKDKLTLEEYKKICWDYGRKLGEKGWTRCMIEGGYISPDNSTIYIYNRSPYEGQLLNFIPNTKKQYEEICNQFRESNDFMYESELMKEIKQYREYEEELEK